MNKEKLSYLFKVSDCFVFLFFVYIGTSAFSIESQKELKSQSECCMCGTSLRGRKKKKKAEGSHFNHSRADIDGLDYDNPRRGGLMCKRCHYKWHADHVGSASLIGLSEEQNIQSLFGIWDRLNARHRKQLTSPEYYNAVVKTGNYVILRQND